MEGIQEEVKGTMGWIVAPDPPTVGQYELGRYVNGTTTHYSLIMQLYKKPSFIKRFCMKHLLGFDWKDYKKKR